MTGISRSATIGLSFPGIKTLRILALIKVTPLLLGTLMMTSCTHSPDGNETGNLQDQRTEIRPRRTILDLDDQTRKNRILGFTNNFMNKLGDVVTEENKEPLKMVVLSHFIAATDIRMALAADQRNANGNQRMRLEASGKFRNDMSNLASKTNAHAKDLLDKKDYKVFDKTLASFLPRTVNRPYYPNDDGGDWGWLDGDITPLDGSSSFDGRAGP